MMTTASNNLASRRDFLKTSALVGGALAVPAFLPKDLYGQEKKDVLRVGLIGCGGRG